MDKIEEALRLIKGLLDDPSIAEPLNVADRPPRVFFDELRPDCLNLQITYAYNLKVDGRDPVTFQQHVEMINLRILRTLAEAELEIAFPSRTVYLSTDSRRELSVRVMNDATAASENQHERR